MILLQRCSDVVTGSTRKVGVHYGMMPLSFTPFTSLTYSGTDPSIELGGTSRVRPAEQEIDSANERYQAILLLLPLCKWCTYPWSGLKYYGPCEMLKAPNQIRSWSESVIAAIAVCPPSPFTRGSSQNGYIVEPRFKSVNGS